MDLISNKKNDLNQQLEDIQAVLIELTGLETNCQNALASIDK
jgi:prefoldin subunit 5